MVSPVHVGRALESLRNSNYNTVSAMGEVIDNSIEAEAKNIRIKIQKTPVRKNKDDYTEVAFTDDGKGMNKEILNQCLQLGFSERYNNRKGIGRFGVGMTLGAITQCTRIEVFSKPRGAEWLYTYIDIDETKDSANPEIPEPVRQDIPTEYADMVQDYGTLVIWKNWDREDAKIDEMKEWIGRTYRKFIGHEIVKDGKVIVNNNRVDIYMDGEKISALDPLYATKTQYNQETATIYAPIKLTNEIHQKFDPPQDKKTGTGTIKITFSLLPEEWRYKERIGASEDNKKRRVNNNEGISILRNGREVFYGHIAHFDLQDKANGRGFIFIDRYWGCEIEFDAYLDHWFSVKNIKVGAKPLPELREKLEEATKDTIYECREAIRKVWQDAKAREKTEDGAFSGTDDATETLAKTSKNKKPSATDIDEVIRTLGETKDKEREELRLKMENQQYTFQKSRDLDRGSNFVDIKTHGAATLITLNMKHPLFEKFYEILDKLDAKDMTKNDGHVIRTEIEAVLQILMGSYAAAQKEIDDDRAQTGKEFKKKIMRNWTAELEENIEVMVGSES